MRHTVAALALSACLSLLGTTRCMPHVTSPAAPALHGAQVHVLWDAPDPTEVTRQLDLLTELHATTARVDVAWASMQEQGPQTYSWWYVHRLDQFVAGAAARGIRPVITLSETPCWASTAPQSLRQDCTGAYWERGTQEWAPRGPQDFARAAVWVAARYGTRAAALELWNEPNYDDSGHANLRAPDKAGAYAGMVEAAYPAVKAVAPSLPVLVGALSYSDGDFFRAALARGLRHYDGLSVHPYTDGRAPDAVGESRWRKVDFVAGLDALRATMVGLGQANHPLWITEAGWTTCTGPNRLCVSESDQAAYLARASAVAAARPWIHAFIGYTLLDRGTDPADTEGSFGLVRADGGHKPAFAALRAAFVPGAGR